MPLDHDVKPTANVTHTPMDLQGTTPGKSPFTPVMHGRVLE
jgi:hypothetical protein